MANDKSNFNRYFVTDTSNVYTAKSIKHDDYRLGITNLENTHNNTCNIEVVIANVEDADNLIVELKEIRSNLMKDLMEV